MKKQVLDCYQLIIARKCGNIDKEYELNGKLGGVKIVQKAQRVKV